MHLTCPQVQYGMKNGFVPIATPATGMMMMPPVLKREDEEDKERRSGHSDKSGFDSFREDEQSNREEKTKNNNNNNNNAKKRFGIFFLRPTHQFSIRGGWCVRVESIGGLLKEPRERKSIIIFGWRALTCGGVEDQKPKKTNAGRVKAICASKRIF